MSEFIADGKYLALRGYLEEHSSLLRQILDELKAQGKMENARIRNAVEKSLIDTLERTDKPADVVTSRIEGQEGVLQEVSKPKAAVGPVTVETVQTVDKTDTKGKSKADSKKKPDVDTERVSWAS